MNCIICLEPFETQYAFIPELNCECMFITHDECWLKWTGDCLYCRKVGIPELRHHGIPPHRMIMAVGSIIYLVCSILYFIGHLIK